MKHCGETEPWRLKVRHLSELKPGERVALVTGSGRRLGLAMAQALAADGWAVVFHANSAIEPAEAAAAAAREAGGQAVAIQADLSDPDALGPLVEAASAAFGPLTLLVNNAGVFEHDGIRTTTKCTIATNLNLNLIAPMLLTQAFVGQLPKGMAGNVVNILDQRVANPTPNYMSYTASKVALAVMTRTWALELAPAIRVNGIGPGMALPDPGNDEAGMKTWTDGYPLRRGTSPEEISDALRYILSAPAMTGQILHLDGGQNLGWLHPEGGYPLKPGQV